MGFRLRLNICKKREDNVTKVQILYHNANIKGKQMKIHPLKNNEPKLRLRYLFKL